MEKERKKSRKFSRQYIIATKISVLSLHDAPVVLWERNIVHEVGKKERKFEERPFEEHATAGCSELYMVVDGKRRNGNKWSRNEFQRSEIAQTSSQQGWHIFRKKNLPHPFQETKVKERDWRVDRERWERREGKWKTNERWLAKRPRGKERKCR